MKRYIITTLLALVAIALQAQNIKAVDLGLSVKWADADLGSADGESKYYFQWGEPKGVWMQDYKASAYPPAIQAKLDPNKTIYRSQISSQLAERVGKDNILLPQYDAARVILRSHWRMPNKADWTELIEKCKFEWDRVNGRKCIKVTGPNGNHIFLTNGGWLDSDNNKLEKYYIGKVSYYWSSEVMNYGYGPAEIISFWCNNNPKGKIEPRIDTCDFPARGILVRPVYDDRTPAPQPAPQPTPKPQPQPKPAPVVTVKAVPTFTWASLPATTTLTSVKISVGIRSKSQITATHVYVNGQKYRGIKAVTNDGSDMRIEQTVPLVEGSNIIKVSATNADGTATSERTVVRQTTKPVTETQGKRIALVIGNSAYPAQRLTNPQNDAADMAAKLKTLGFEVILLQNGTKRQMDDAINQLGQRAQGYDAAMFYYAGHGIQYKGANYLIPINANMHSASDVEYECTDLGRVLDKLDESGCKMKIIALDACRNNPFERSWYRGSTDRGLSAVNAPVGTFISYATSPGSVAADGQNRNSPYTTALLQTLDTPGLSIETVFKRVAASVFTATNRQQTPWYSSSLFQGDFIFNNK